MLGRLNIYQKIAIALLSMVTAALALLLCLNFLKIAPRYSDFIVGRITWNAATKLQDLMAMPIFIALAFVSIALILSAFLSVSKQRVKPFELSATVDLLDPFMWWMLPAATGILTLPFLILPLGIRIDPELFYISAAGIGFICVTIFSNKSKIKDTDIQAISLSVFAILLIALIPLEIALTLGRLSISMSSEINFSRGAQAVYLTAAVGLAGGLFYAIYTPQQLSRFLPGLLLISQIGLSTLFLTLYPAKLLQPDQTLSEYQTTIGLKLLIGGIVLWSILDVIRRFRKYASTAHWVALLSPIALFALLLGLKVGHTVAPDISPDDYHFGEKLLGAWSYLQGVIPYVGYLPAHGLISDDFTQWLSFIFYDGSAASLQEAGRISFAILALAAFLALYYFSASIGLAWVAIFFLGGQPTWLFLTPFLCLWLSQTLRKNPARWLTIWIVTAPIVIFGVPPQGVLLVTASGVMAACFCWRLWRYPEERSWKGIGTSLTALVILGLLTRVVPLGPMLFGAVHYVFENGPINQIAYGIPWEQSWHAAAQRGFKLEALALEALRMSWVAVPLGCLVIIYASAKNWIRRQHALPALVVLLFILLLIPYSMGRIDPGVLSRSGSVALFGWTVLLPIVAWRVLNPNNRTLLIFFIGCSGTALNMSAPSFSNFVASAAPRISTALLREGARIGLANIGKASVQDEHWDRLSRLQRLLSARLTPKESYLDLSGRNAQYFYLNRRPVIPITAPYNLVSLAQQKRAVAQLAQNLPKIALLEGNNIIHDGGGLALRNPYLYRFIIENYDPSFEDGFIVGYKKSAIRPSISTEYKKTLFQQAFSQSDLQKIPVAWGKSAQSLAKKMILIKSLDGIAPMLNQLTVDHDRYTVNGVDPFLSFDISSAHLSGRDAGLLKFDFSCESQTAEPRIQVFWWGDDRPGPSEAYSVKFTADTGTLIVPVDASPRWLMLDQLKGIRIGLDNASACREIRVNHIGLFQRNFE